MVPTLPALTARKQQKYFICKIMFIIFISSVMKAKYTKDYFAIINHYLNHIKYHFLVELP